MQGASKVGLLVVAFGVLLFLAYAVLGRSIFAPKTTTYYADFADAGGIAVGAKVLMAGVKIGMVTEVKLKSPNYARLKLEIEDSIKIPKGSIAMLTTSLIGFGDNPVQIMPPTKQTDEYLTVNMVLKGVKGSALSSIMPESSTTLNELNKTLAATRKLIEDEKLKKSIETLIASSDRTITQFGNLANNANSLIAQNKTTMTKAMSDAASAIHDIKKGIAVATKLLQDESLKNKVAGILDKLNATSTQAETLVKSLNDFINDPKLRDPMNATMQNVKTITDSGTRIAASTEDMAKNGVTITEKAIQLADKASLIADEARETLKKLQGFFQKVPSGSSLGKIESRMDIIRESNPGHFRTDVEVIAPIKDFKLHLGVYDAFETNKLTVQIGQKFAGVNEYRYGVYAGKPGFGVDWRLAPNLHLEGNLFDLNDTRLDVRARYDFGNNFVGWLGINRAFDGNSAMIGIGFRK